MQRVICNLLLRTVPLSHKNVFLCSFYSHFNSGELEDLVDRGHLRDALQSLVDVMVAVVTDLERGKRDFSAPFEK